MERSELIQLRVTPEEKKRIRELATAHGYNHMSEYILDVLDGKITDTALKLQLLALLDDPDVARKIQRK
jgi:uncharacterized protein (DUF1778 family)